MDHTGPCKCPCGWNAGGDLRVTEQDFTGELVVTEDMGPDDHHFCPDCDRELDNETVVPREATDGQFQWNFVVVEGDLQLASQIDDAFAHASASPRLHDILIRTEGVHS